MLEITKKIVSDTELLLSISVPQEEVCILLRKELLHIQANKVIPGFRKGKVPKHLVQELWGEQVKASFINRQVPVFLQQSVEKENISFLGSPSIIHMSEPSEEQAFSLQCKIVRYPYATIQSLSSLSLPKLEFEYNLDDFVQIEIKRILRDKATILDVDLNSSENVSAEFQILTLDIFHEKEDGDTVDLSLKDFQLEISPWIQDPYHIKTHCIGMQSNSSKKIQIHYPPDHQNPFLCGKSITFLVTLKKIQLVQIPKDTQSITGKTPEDLENICKKILTEKIILFTSKKKREILIKSLLLQSSFYIPEEYWELALKKIQEEVSPQKLRESMLPHLQEMLIIQALFDITSVDASNLIENYVQYLSSISGDSTHEIKKNLLKRKDYKKLLESFREFQLIDTLYTKFSENSKNIDRSSISYLEIM